MRDRSRPIGCRGAARDVAPRRRWLAIVFGLGCALLLVAPAARALTLGNEGEGGRGLEITGSKVFEMKQADVNGDIGHFSTENFDSIPGFRLDQSLHLEMDGYIDRNAKVHAVLDDKTDEDRRFTINIDGRVWDLTLGDFPVSILGTEFTLHKKEVQGILAVAELHPRWRWMFLASRAKGVSRREQFRGAGQQQEFRLLARPVVANSERVLVDGRPLTRGTDYLIDYEDGVLKLNARVLPIEATQWIVIEYEVSDRSLLQKRNLYGTRLEHQVRPDRRLGLSWLREIDGDPAGDGEVSSATARPQSHSIMELDTDWRINPMFTLRGETSLATVDPNTRSDETELDREKRGLAYRFGLTGRRRDLELELTERRIDRDFRVIGREGAAELGERGLVNDIRKRTGRGKWQWRPEVSVFGQLEAARTNLSGAADVSTVDFDSAGVGATWKYRPESQVEVRINRQNDFEQLADPLSNQTKTVAAGVWDHRWSRLVSQSKLESTRYTDLVHPSSATRALQYQLRLGDQAGGGNLLWQLALEKFLLDDELVSDQIRSDTDNYTLDLQYNPHRALNLRSLIQWRRELDYFDNSRQDSEVADASLRYRPRESVSTQIKYKVENTTKVIRDPSLDPARYQRPPSLPQDRRTTEEVVGRFENPVTKRTANLVTTWQPYRQWEGTFDWRFRDLRDRATRSEVSRNDRKLYELKWTPNQKLRLISDFETAVALNLAPRSELWETIKRFEAHHEFWRGYILAGKFEDRYEDDIVTDDNDKRTRNRGVDFQRIFSPMTTLELGINRGELRAIKPQSDWTSKLAVIVTPGGRNQRYRFFLSHAQIEGAEKSGLHQEGGLEFSQFIGTDTIIDGQVKKVRSSAGNNGAGYDAMVANGKIVITF